MATAAAATAAAAAAAAATVAAAAMQRGAGGPSSVCVHRRRRHHRRRRRCRLCCMRTDRRALAGVQGRRAVLCKKQTQCPSARRGGDGGARAYNKAARARARARARVCASLACSFAAAHRCRRRQMSSRTVELRAVASRIQRATRVYSCTRITDVTFDAQPNRELFLPTLLADEMQSRMSVRRGRHAFKACRFV